MLTTIVTSTILFCAITSKDYDKNLSEKKGFAICKRHVSDTTKNKLYKQANVIKSKEYCINHKIPLALGGSNNIENLEVLHVNPKGKCHGKNELKAIYCLQTKKCTQAEAINML